MGRIGSENYTPLFANINELHASFIEIEIDCAL